MNAEDAGSPVVVVTAMQLSAAARAELSEMLGIGYVVVDIKSAPETANIVLTPVVSGQLLGVLRVKFPRARILFTELHDGVRGIDFSGPLSHIVARGPDGYFVAHALDALAPVVQTEARLQLDGSTWRSPPRLLAGPAPAMVPTANAAPDSMRAEPHASMVIWIDRDTCPSVPAGRWLDLKPIDDMVARVVAAVDPRRDALWPAVVAECAVRIATGQQENVLVDVRGIAPSTLADIQIRLASEHVDHTSWPLPGPT